MTWRTCSAGPWRPCNCSTLTACIIEENRKQRTYGILHLVVLCPRRADHFLKKHYIMAYNAVDYIPSPKSETRYHVRLCRGTQEDVSKLRISCLDNFSHSTKHSNTGEGYPTSCVLGDSYCNVTELNTCCGIYITDKQQRLIHVRKLIPEWVSFQQIHI